ncbi:GntR family transcriptional regulator [Stella humosa]|uniref:GntR family transcriptional regulator n=1 Tax=Stella humosa TaxID=94 RepID=A0A3N1L0Q3_9PROT|nr:FCD domain-containing protein [Stella humosa]ROP84540.1 GntR family transcriptional regulator [Stella humosa]BBK34060.1 hypothetical protein STHU_46940 [Stella humosa]
MSKAGLPPKPPPSSASASSLPAAAAAIAQRRSESLGTIVHKELERMILSGEIKAGERVSEQLIAAQLGVSRGPVREATSALERSGLLTSIANRGVFVREVSTDELLELYDMRALLTGFACALISTGGSREQKDRLAAMVEGMGQALEAGDGRRYYQANLEFHDALMAFSGHGKAAQIYETLLKEAHLSRRGVLSAPPMMGESNAEHVAIIQAIQAGDGDRARILGEDHVLAGKRRLLKARAAGLEAGPESDSGLSEPALDDSAGRPRARRRRTS